ncbi:class I SAM-dependent methyltransferase [Rhodopirellula sp. JC740]|uniref:Class I SAM-dependent methyltransferase n=1 Tax=Rhodopirellula halodulae TaxID=2894198 RepID=A0ABS8NJR3_9BACT|nr:methyltransferase [Rhodopirellula sp. JC740]MCC9643761.1 class I SAM-dependent methyltransferase [Rhodopirellula sp. JC740]
MSDLPPLPSEKLLLDQLDELIRTSPTAALVMSPGRGQIANALADRIADGNVVSWFVDSHRAELANEIADDAVQVVCQPDLPDEVIDLAVLPVLKNGEAEMNRDLIHQAWKRLKVGGELWAAVNAAQDAWLLSQLQALGPKVRCHDQPGGRVYGVRKTSDRFKQKTFDAEFTHRVDERVISVHSRPSVFSHRSVDRAAAVMIRNVAVPKGSVVLELGCGNGAVAMAAALRSETGHAYAVDCNTRAVQCVQRAAEQNGINNLTAIVNHDGRLPDLPPCDLVLLNPPYYGDFQIAEHFLVAAGIYLRPGGEAYVVTKQTQRYLEYDWSPLNLIDRTSAQSYDLLKFKKA